MAIDLKKMNVCDLEMLSEAVKGTKLEYQIKKEIDRRSMLTIYESQEHFKSDRLPDFNPEYLCRASQLALEFDVMSLPSMWKSACFDSNNNSKGDFYLGMFGYDKDALDQKWMHNLGYLSLLFRDENLRRQYEGTYNVVNYMINGIYKELNRRSGSIETVDHLFYVLPEKEDLVKDRFSDIVEYLWTVRSEVPGSRSSIGNQGLTANRESTKTKKKWSSSQNALIESVAYGCTLDELEKGNYEGAKRLIYVPNSKIRK